MIDYDPFGDQALEDPYPLYRDLREQSPVHYLEKFDCWALSRFKDIWTVSADGERFSVREGTSAPQLLSKVLPVFPNLNHVDPPNHTELRGDLWRFFTPRAVRGFEERLRTLTRERLEALRPLGGFDVMSDLAFPVSSRMACIMVGFPEEDADELVGQVRRFFRREDGVEGMTEDGMAAYEEMNLYLQDLTRRRLAEGAEADSPVNILIRRETLDGERPSVEVRGSHLMLMLLGSTETFPKTFASALYRLAEHPDQRAEVLADLSLIPDAFDEVLRYDAPTQFLCRTASCDVEIRGTTIREGRPVMLLYPSGNRDPREYDDPDRFDIHRRPGRMLTFGTGIHRCMGVHFARLEGRVLLEETLRAIPDYEVVESGVHQERTEFVRGFRTLPIQFD
jgi:cytochrome P450